MTDDANNTNVTRAYRDLATETTPAALDDKILKQAAHEARSRYGIARAWIRPVAWAATIGLSLAIVLEVGQLIPSAQDQAAPAAEAIPASEPIVEPLAEPVAEPVAAAKSAESQKREFADSAPERLRQQQAAPAQPSDVSALRKDIADAPAVGRLESTSQLPNPGGGGTQEMRPRSTANRTVPPAPQELAEAKEGPAVELDDVDTFAASDMRILEEAEDQARHHAGEPGIAAFALVAHETSTAHCDETARASGDSWYECIEALRESGEIEFADVELEALRLAFPDFEEPEPEVGN